MRPSRVALGLASLVLASAAVLSGCAQTAQPAGPGATSPSGPSATSPGAWQTSPGSTPSSSSSQSPSPTGASAAAPISAAQLPEAKDLAYNEFGDFMVDETGKGAGESITDCFEVKDNLLGASTTIHRSYTAFPGQGKEMEVPALAIGLQFGSEAQAAQAYRDFQKFSSGCVARLRSTGNKTGAVTEWRNVDSVATAAGFFEFGYATDGDMGRFESLGAVQHGSRMVVLLMYANGQDFNWAYQKNDSTGLPLHPFIRSLPRVAQRLA